MELLIEKLKIKLDFDLVYCEFVQRNNLLFLDIEINSPTLREIKEKSKIISDILDEIDSSDNNYYLNIFSSGAEKEINIDNIENYINKNIKTFLTKEQNNGSFFEGELVEVTKATIKMRINFKGHFRKLEFDKNNIKQLNESIKLTKNKKDKKNEKNKPTRFN